MSVLNINVLRKIPETENNFSTNKTIWLSAEKLNGGDGSLNNPLSANTKEKLDAIWAANTGPCNFYYLPGVYETSGWYFVSRTTARPNQKHYGSGIGVTTIRLEDSSTETADGVVFGSDYNVSADGFGLFDMTVDANGDNQPKKLISSFGMALCVTTFGSNIQLRNVEFKGYGTFSGSECFPVFLVVSGPGVAARTYENIVIADCIFRDPAHDNDGGLSVCSITVPREALPGAGGGLNTMRNSVIERCYFESNAAGGFDYEHSAFAQIVRDNWFNLSDQCIYLETTGATGLAENVSITGNTFRIPPGGKAIYVNHGSNAYDDFRNMVIENNRFLFTGDTTLSVGIGQVAGGLTGTVENLIIKNNTFVNEREATSATNLSYGIILENTVNGIIENNIFGLFSSSLLLATAGVLSQNLFFKNNRKITGEEITSVYCINGTQWYPIIGLLPPTTFALRVTLPAEGLSQSFTDSSTETWGATITGGGAYRVLGRYNGTNWTVYGK